MPLKFLYDIIVTKITLTKIVLVANGKTGRITWLYVRVTTGRTGSTPFPQRLFRTGVYGLLNI
jgi:hypothetical protein